MMRWSLLLLFGASAGWCNALAASGTQVSFFVSPDGNDAGSGTLAEPTVDGKDGPFKTIETARDTIRARGAGQGGPWVVLVREGIYFLSQPLTFAPEDSGSGQSPVTYAAYPGEHPVISGGRRIGGWQRTDAGVGPAKGRLWMAKWGTPSRWCPLRFNVFYVDGARRTRARGPNSIGVREGLYAATEPKAADPRYGTTSFQYSGGDLKNWPSLVDAELDLTLEYTWLNHLLPLAGVDETTHTATLASPAVYTVRGYRVENVLEVLDEPGEWCVDSREGCVYYWPPIGGMEHAEAIAPTMVNAVRFLGDETVGRFVHDIVFRGFTVAHADRTRELRSNRPQFCGDSLDGAILLRGAERITVEGCTVADTGAWGILLDLCAQHNRIIANTVVGAGAGGVTLLGYGPGTKDVNHHNEVSWNKIHHCGRIYYHSPGISALQSGENRIEHNLVFDMPYCGIWLLGQGSEYFRQFKGVKFSPFNVPDWPYWLRWDEIDPNDPLTPDSVVQYRHARNNLVQYNVCYDLMNVVQDGGAYYNCSSGADNIVRRNLAKDISSWGFNLAIYQDYESQARTLEENVLIDAGKPGNVPMTFWGAQQIRMPDGRLGSGGVAPMTNSEAFFETMMGVADTFQFAGAMDRPANSLARRLIDPLGP